MCVSVCVTNLQILLKSFLSLSNVHVACFSFLHGQVGHLQFIEVATRGHIGLMTITYEYEQLAIISYCCAKNFWFKFFENSPKVT